MPQTNDIKFSKLFLSSGRDFLITDLLTCKHPTVEDIINIDKRTNGLMSEDIYFRWVELLTVDPYSYMVYLDDHKLDYERVSEFDLFIMLFQETIKKIKDSGNYEDIVTNPYFGAFGFFFGINEFFVVQSERGENFIVNSDGKCIINSEIYAYISEFIRCINGLQPIDRINPEDDNAKSVLIDDERENQKKEMNKGKKHSPINRIGNLLSSVTWASHGAINPFNRNKLHIYDLVDGLSRTDRLMSYNNTMTGLYSGCIDKKNIDFEKIHWSL